MLSLSAYLHRIDPFVVRFPDVAFLPEGIRWYGLSYLVGFLIAGLLIWRVTKVGKSTLHPANVPDMVVSIAIGVVIGGRLGYVLFYEPELLVSFGDSPPWWGLLAFNRGGMASHGGMIGAVLACLYVAKRGTISPRAAAKRADASPTPARRGKRDAKAAAATDQKPARVTHSWAHILDLAALGTPLGLFFGRIANFINGELYGRPCDPDMPLAVKFTQELHTWSLDRLPALREVVVQVGVDAGQWVQALSQYDRDVDARLLVQGTVDKLIAATQTRTPMGDAVAAGMRPLLTPRHPSQLYQALLEGLLVFLMLLFIWRKPRKPGVIGASFVMAYGVMRIIGEFFREPDAQIGYQWLNLTRGQWISATMLIAGPIVLYFCARRRVEKLGGWRGEVKSEK